MATQSTTAQAISGIDCEAFSQDLLFTYQELWTRVFDENEVFRYWAQQRQPWHLYCSGPPRAGKTTFTAAVARHLRSQQKVHTAVVTIYLGLLDQKVVSSRETLEVVLRAILQQLVHTHLASRRDSASCSEDLTGPCEFSTVPLNVSLENLLEMIKDEVRNFENVFILVDGVNQCHILSGEELREHLIGLDSMSVMYVGLPLSLLSYEEQSCDACGDKPLVTLWAECESCNVCYCEDCFVTKETCCSSMLSPTPIVEFALDTPDYPWKAYVERRLSDDITQDETVEDLIDTIGKESGYSFPLAKLCVDTLLEGNAMEDIAALRDRLPDYQLRYFNYALWPIRNQPMAEDVSLGLAALSLIALAGSITLSFSELQAALRELNRNKATFGNAPISRERISRVTQGWLRESREDDTVSFFTDSARSYVLSECEDFHQEALPALSNTRDFGLTCLNILTQPVSLEVFRSMAQDLHNILTTLQRYPFLAYAFEHWPEHLQNYSTNETFRAVDRLLDQYHSSKLQYISQVMAGQQWTVAATGHKLHIIANLDLTRAIKYHITHAIDINIADPGTGRTPIMVACGVGNSDTVREMMRCGANLASRCRFGRTALGYAVRNAHVNVVNCLLDESTSALIGVGDEKEDSVLTLAIELCYEEGSKNGKQEEIVKTLLIKGGQNLFQTGRNGKTVLHRAADLVDLASLQLILDVNEYKTAIDTREDNETGRTALMNVLQSRSPSVTAETRYEAVKVMISSGASTDSTDGMGRSVIHYAATNDDFVEILEFLIDEGVNLQVQDAHGWTPLHVACAHDCPRIAALLIKSRSRIVAVTEAGVTPLDTAKSVGSHSVIELLLKAQASNNSETEQCKQIIEQDLIRTYDQREEIDVLGNNILHRAVLYTHDTHEVQRLLQSGQVNIDCVNIYKQTALHLALRRLEECTSAEEEDEREQAITIDIVNILIGHPDIALNITDHWHDQALDVAIRLLRSESWARDMILDLLTAGAEFTRTPNDIDALLCRALVREAHPKPHLIRKLLDAGANVFRQFSITISGTKEEKYPWQIAHDRKMHPVILSQLEMEQSRRLQVNVVYDST